MTQERALAAFAYHSVSAWVEGFNIVVEDISYNTALAQTEVNYKVFEPIAFNEYSTVAIREFLGY